MFKFAHIGIIAVFAATTAAAAPYVADASASSMSSDDAPVHIVPQGNSAPPRVFLSGTQAKQTGEISLTPRVSSPVKFESECSPESYRKVR
jgi:hypothetical protein